jgi:hypothetical protein
VKNENLLVSQPCPICLVPAGVWCHSEAGWRLNNLHTVRSSTEFGKWSRVYDALYRELPVGERFIIGVDPKPRRAHRAKYPTSAVPSAPNPQCTSATLAA